MTMTNALPTEISHLFESCVPQGRGLLLAAKSEIDLDGHPAQQWLFATDKELLVARPEGDPPRLLRRLNHEQINGIRTHRVVGSSFLQAKVGSHWVDLMRYCNDQTETFREVASHLEPLCLRGEFPMLEEESEAKEAEQQAKKSPVGRMMSRVRELVMPYRWSMALMLALSFLSVGVELAPPILQQILVDDVLKVESAERPSFDDLGWMLLAIVGGLAAVRLASSGLAIWKGHVSSRVGTSLTADLRTRMVKKLHELSISYHDRHQVGMLMSRVAYDTENMHTLIHQLTSGFLLQLLQLVGIGVMLFWINPKLAFFTLLPMPLVIVGSFFFTRYLTPRHHRYWDAVGRQAASLTGMLSGIRVVKAFTQENREYKRFECSSNRLRDSRMEVDVCNATFSSLMGFTFALGGLIVWFVGGRDVLSEEMTLGSLMAFLAYLAMFYTPLTTLSEGTAWFSNFLAASQRIFEVLDQTESLEENHVERPDHRFQGHVQLENISFGYDPDMPVLHDVSVDIKPGEMIGIVGRSGSGKSTLVNLISRLYDVNKGRILVDGHDLREFSGRQIRQQVGMVLQEPFLFKGTIENNIVYGNPEATPEEILKAAKGAHAHDFILRMPFGYESMVGEQGSGLSGGERQRISIARALLYDPQILILDEATSSVDTESERAIQAAIEAFSRGRTTIAIAHRLSTLRNADRLLVFDQGRLVEQGSHDALLKEDGLYASLVKMQSVGASIPQPVAAMAGGGTIDEAFEFSENALEEAEYIEEPEEEPLPEPSLVWLTPETAKLYSGKFDLLHIEFEGETYEGIDAVLAFPATRNSEFISLQAHDAEGRVIEIGMMRDLADWPQEVQEKIRGALARRYFMRRVRSIDKMETKQGLLHCWVTTEEGRRNFTMQTNEESFQPYGKEGRLMIDTVGNHYLIPCLKDLSTLQRGMLKLHFAD
ncbi:ABC-type multidrug transport system, ATPase and permease component [Planctomycetales bacterium 10988]|nr:ABC-type multidrug transport system, ATPase and permease component [Planctomycetales bacterium 10988]